MHACVYIQYTYMYTRYDSIWRLHFYTPDVVLYIEMSSNVVILHTKQNHIILRRMSNKIMWLKIYTTVDTIVTPIKCYSCFVSLSCYRGRCWCCLFLSFFSDLIMIESMSLELWILYLNCNRHIFKLLTAAVAAVVAAVVVAIFVVHHLTYVLIHNINCQTHFIAIIWSSRENKTNQMVDNK